MKDQVNNQITNEGGADITYGRFLDELGWEFDQEGHRRTDLIRFGVFTKKSWLSHTAWVVFIPSFFMRVFLS